MADLHKILESFNKMGIKNKGLTPDANPGAMNKVAQPSVEQSHAQLVESQVGNIQLPGLSGDLAALAGIKKPVQEADPDTLGNMNSKMKDVLSKVHGDDQAKAQAEKDKAEAERQAKVKELGPNAMERYVELLKRHDWTYQYSDDHSVWKRGQAEADAIRKLGDIVDPERNLYKKHSPFYEAVKEQASKKQEESLLKSLNDYINEIAGK